MGRFRALGNSATSVVAFGAALALVLGGGASASADQLAIDGDGLAPVAGPAGQPASVSACTDQAVEFTVLIAARRNGGANVTFDGGSPVAVWFADHSTSGMTAVLSEQSIVLPSNWAASGNNTLSADTVAATVTLPAQNDAGTGSIWFSFSGENMTDGTHSGESKLDVSWTTTQCITDSIAPVLTLPTHFVVEATGPDGATVEFPASAMDETAPAVPEVSCTPASGSVLPLGTTTVSCSATDAAGNAAAGTFDVIVQDTTSPAVGAMSDIGFEAMGLHTIVTWTDPMATDAVSGNPAVTCTPPSATGFLVGETTVTCTATDGAGNTGSATFTVTISDTSEPSLVLPNDLTVEATGPSGATVEFEASAFDLVDGEVAVTCAPASGSTFALGQTTVTCDATDSRGNGASGSFTVDVVDTTAPEVTTPESFVLEATGPGGAAAVFAATAEDVVDGALTPSCSPESGATLPLGTTTVTCTATDAAGNTGASSFTVTVVDTTPPAIEVPDTVVVEATGPAGAAVEYSVTADDIVDGAVEPNCEPASGATFALGGTQVDCVATDDAGNSANASFAVQVVDTSPPVITWVGGPADGGAYVFGSVPAAGSCTAVDLVDQDVDCDVTGYGTAVGSHGLVASATDDAGNTATAARSYQVLAWTLGGFFQPVDMSGVWNSVKGGATVPLKFEVFAGATELTSTSAVQGFTVKGVSCPGSATVTDDIELTTTGGTSLRYDATAGQFIQNWQTPKKSGACYQVTMTTQDESSISALFKLK